MVKAGEAARRIREAREAINGWNQDLNKAKVCIFCQIDISLAIPILSCCFRFRPLMPRTCSVV